jgi:DNA-binding response OmpR family regulator
MELDKHSKTILVVDDEHAIRGLVRIMLETEGYTVLTAGDAETAIKIYEENQSAVALLLTDVVMPKMNGVQLADRVLQMEPRMRILFMSAGSSANRGYGCLAKPFALTELIRRVGATLGSPPDPQPAGLSAAWD